eukprot:350560_1
MFDFRTFFVQPASMSQIMHLYGIYDHESSGAGIEFIILCDQWEKFIISSILYSILITTYLFYQANICILIYSHMTPLQLYLNVLGYEWT